MSLSILLPFLVGTGVLIVVGLMLLYDAFRVGTNIAQIIFSTWIASGLSWSLWLLGNFIIASFFSSNDVAWDINVITAMTIGPPAARWVLSKAIFSDDSRVMNEVTIALAGAAIGALFGRFVLSEAFPEKYTGIGNSGSAIVTWTWLGALVGGHAYAAVEAFRNVVHRREL